MTPTEHLFSSSPPPYDIFAQSLEEIVRKDEERLLEALADDKNLTAIFKTYKKSSEEYFEYTSKRSFSNGIRNAFRLMMDI